MENPYRETSSHPKYLCAQCWKTASALPGICCGQERRAIDEQTTENDLRAMLQRRRNARRTRDTRIIVAAIVIGAPLLCWLEGRWTMILAAALAIMGIGAVAYSVIIRAQGWPNAWHSPLPSLLRFLKVQSVDVSSGGR